MLAEGRVGAVACDPTYQASRPPPSAPSVRSGPPPVPPKWGELDESVVANRSLLDGEGALPEEAPQIRDLPPEHARGGKVPVEFDMVDAPDIELALPTAPAIPAGTPSSAPSPELPAGASVLVESKFFERLPLAFVAPLLGKAWALLLFSALVPACASLLLSLDVSWVLQVIFFVPTLLFSIGLLTEAFSRLAQEGADNDEGVPSPTLGDTQLQTVLGSGIATVFVAAFLFVFPGYLFYRQAIGLTALTALSFLPYIYWPMALTVQGMTGNLVAGFDVPLVFRSMARAPLKYLVVVALGFVLTMALSFGATLVVGGLMVTAGPSRVLVFGATFVFFGTMTYLHGVLGYAMGRLVATEDKLANSF